MAKKNPMGGTSNKNHGRTPRKNDDLHGTSACGKRFTVGCVEFTAEMGWDEKSGLVVLQTINGLLSRAPW